MKTSFYWLAVLAGMGNIFLGGIDITLPQNPEMKITEVKIEDEQAENQKNEKEQQSRNQVFMERAGQTVDFSNRQEAREFVYREFRKEFGEKVAQEAVKISKCESSFDSNAKHKNRNGSIDVGLMQINSVHSWRGDATNPIENIRIAKDIYREQGGWNAWACKGVIE